MIHSLNALHGAPFELPIVAVGDTQEHESTGFPLHDNDSAIDAYVEVAQRPPEQTLFGRRILEWALASHPDEPFIHLGDVMDLSCRAEAVRMAHIFRANQNAGAILLGNHDGLMFGIYAYSLLEARRDPGATKWNQACRRGAHPEDADHQTANEALTKVEPDAYRDQPLDYGLPRSGHPGHGAGLQPGG